jgi:hypothetical protein
METAMTTGTEQVVITILGGLPVVAQFTHQRPSWSVGHAGGVEDITLYWPQSRGGKLRQVPQTIYDRIAKRGWSEVEEKIADARCR